MEAASAATELAADHDDVEIGKNDLLRMGVAGEANISDVSDLLNLSRADIHFESADRGYGMRIGQHPEDQSAVDEFLAASGKLGGKRKH
ncbi:hypothetical protein [Rhizobium tumorigenes]|uniref:Uncharacterized protein n=1 Tax=Rhizobium tumorigenes TaxID=2041385 RepID=A0AAF1K8J3_9HYPH|nr:hypothetical protein [Rhizobium tumorigenes]WFR97760.1 hypothetical protein PR017_21610 [Rhizobium tumorigenes]